MGGGEKILEMYAEKTGLSCEVERMKNSGIPDVKIFEFLYDANAEQEQQVRDEFLSTLTRHVVEMGGTEDDMTRRFMVLHSPVENDRNFSRLDD